MSQIIAVNLPADTIYVSGTVNGVAKTWTNTEGSTWETIADKAEDGKYLVELTIISSLGTSNEESFVLYYGVVSLITDRTAEDARRAMYLAGLRWSDMSDDEKAEWSSDLKGAYNASDLNRVEGAVRYLAEILQALPSELKTYGQNLGVAWDRLFSPNYEAEDMLLETKIDWLKSDIPNTEDMERYLSNVITLRNAIDYATDRLPTSMDNLTWQGANAIERAIKGLDTAIILFRAEAMANMENAAKAWFFSDEIYTGEV